MVTPVMDSTTKMNEKYPARINVRLSLTDEMFIPMFADEELCV